ncbi:PEP-CTERM motif protein [Maioricimonas rarisocia]|uniref:PEP-CTERM motif protein n=1 Tax=Maioricimonas rarisocia TaxID=2528026 RepID=A0A517ZE57_9PLAN|nr:PEP-CTERM sorting domain-containing protein [Maioricimonas rarisocia]QDU40739.1 PEP-CTERM motif protein [Maioricimonas rarisocia]
MRDSRLLRLVPAIVFVVLCAFGRAADADSPLFSTQESSKYLIISMGPQNNQPAPPDSNVGVGIAMDGSNNELGAMRAPVPSTSGFLSDKLTDDPGTGWPDLIGSVPPVLPSNAQDVFQGVTYTGNIAVTHPDGAASFSNVGIYADPAIGVEVTSSANIEDVITSSNSFFNDYIEVQEVDDNGDPIAGATEMVPGYPNTFFMDKNGKLVPNLQQGVFVKADADTDSLTLNANQDAKIGTVKSSGAPKYPGVNQVDHTDLLAELATAATAIGNAVATATLDLVTNQGTLDGGFNSSNPSNFSTASTTGPISLSSSGENLTLTLLQSGITVIDVLTGGNAFLLQNMNFVINAVDPTAQVIFRLPGTTGHAETGSHPGQIMDISQANVLAGDNIGTDSILFYTDDDKKGVTYSFDNTILNGVAFWNLGHSGGEIHINNAQGCVQLVADKINLQNVRFNRCAFDTAVNVIPEPSSFALMGLGGLLLAFTRKRRRDEPAQEREEAEPPEDSLTR